MVEFHPVTWVLAILAIAVVISTVPYALVAIEYRRRDNGLAYLLMVIGLGVWNTTFVAQLLSPDPQVKVFFLGLSVVGSVQTGLGWFLFANTASVTSDRLNRRDVYALVSVLGGLDIIFAVTTPVHPFYWRLATVEAGTYGFAAVDPGIGYWLHTSLIVGLFAAGTALFSTRWDAPTASYTRMYTVAGSVTIVAVAASNLLAPGGFGVGHFAAAIVTSTGWLQASRGEPLAWLRSLV